MGRGCHSRPGAYRLHQGKTSSDSVWGTATVVIPPSDIEGLSMGIVWGYGFETRIWARCQGAQDMGRKEVAKPSYVSIFVSAIGLGTFYASLGNK